MSWYHPSVYDRTLPIGSYWETTDGPIDPDCSPLNQSQTCEVAIIGGGFTGLSAALHLAREHGIQAAILEAGMPGWGASGRNGGFCCVGGTALSHQQLIHKFGWVETQRYYQEQRSAIDWVQHLAKTENMAIDPQGEGEIIVAHHPSRLRLLADEQEFLTQIAHYPCQLWSRQELADYGFSSPEAHAALHVGVGFGLNPVKYSRGLARAALKRGVRIYGQSPVITWEKIGTDHLLHTPGGTLRAKTVIIATNGYTDDRSFPTPHSLLPIPSTSLHPNLHSRTLPALSQIITTRPLTDSERSAQGWHTETPVYDTRNLLFYYRLLKDGRFLFGSRGGITGSPTERDRHQTWMVRRLGELFPAWKGIEITHAWNGLVCLSASLTPHLGNLPQDPSIFYALAYHGNGVAAATWSGRWVARLVAEKVTLPEICAVFRQPLQPFPFPFLRREYLRSAYWLYGIRDRLGG
ncbi:NAD(P)/FAD-dependent oxidoreductase [Egbenema bharatensis]|uniref:NAD(P)/FAD-dependent oxidoreductase n=1 Tax=Egbenema bharatensis TaxID=3463334 RepID=UPI003A8A1C28